MRASLVACPAIALLLASAAPPSAADQRARIAAAEADARLAERRSRLFERQAAGERDAATRAARQEAALAARIGATRAAIVAARARVALADRRLAAGRALLAERAAPTLRLVAALQSLARRPGALALARPGSTADIVHVRAALGAIAPLVAARTATLRGEIAGVRRLRAEAADAATALRAGRARLEAQRFALVRMEGEHRLRGRDLDRRALFESDRAIALGERSRELADAIDSADAAAATAADLAALPGPLPRPVRDDRPAAAPPATAGAPAYVLPAAGRLASGLGEVGESGVRSRGLTLAVAPRAVVVAPAAGRVVFARRFRGYGQVVIVDHGDGWTSALTGLATVTVRPGQPVAQGAAIGRAAPGEDARITVELRRRGVAVDLTQLLG